MSGLEIDVKEVVESEDLEHLATVYQMIDTEMKELEEKKKVIREELIARQKKGVEFKPYGLLVIPTKRVDIAKTQANWMKAGLKIPTKVVPEHEEIDAEKFGSMIDWAENRQYKVETEVYQIREAKRGKK